MPVARRFPSAPLQISPGMTHPPSRLCPSDIRHGVPYTFRASQILACSPRRAASYPLPVRQTSALPSASSRFPVAQNTLAVRLTLPLVGRVEVSHLQVSAPCRAHQKKIPPRRDLMLRAVIMRPRVLVVSQANGCAGAASKGLRVPTLEERLLAAREPYHHQPRRRMLPRMLYREQFQRNSRERYRLRLLY